MMSESGGGGVCRCVDWWWTVIVEWLVVGCRGCNCKHGLEPNLEI